jgi:hypothetical protein
VLEPGTKVVCVQGGTLRGFLLAPGRVYTILRQRKTEACESVCVAEISCRCQHKGPREGLCWDADQFELEAQP